MWNANRDSIANGQRFRIMRRDAPVSFGAYLRLLEENQDFTSWYTALLAGADYRAFFWEHAPICAANIDSPAEFVLLDSPALATVRPEPGAFRSHLESEAQGDVVSFRSLGGDALLLAPRATGAPAAYAHLAAFVRLAPESQAHNLWHETGRAVRENLSERKLWLSTSGLGVSWLHIRLDSYPKYYQHRPYAKME